MNKHKYIKITAILFIIITLSTAFMGCSQEKIIEESATTAATATTSAVAKTIVAESEEDASSTTASTVTDSTVSATQTTTAGISVSIGTTGKKGETAPAVSHSSAKKSTTKISKSTTVTKSDSTKKSSAVSTPSKTIPAKTCRLDVECTAILSHKKDLKPGHSNYVPKDGYIIKNYQYVIKSKEDNVYDVLKKACSDNGVKLTAERSSMGIYISGIGNIDEKDCGKMSGWKYRVNGVYPAFNVEKCTVSEGDSIVFTYVLKP